MVLLCKYKDRKLEKATILKKITDNGTAYTLLILPAGLVITKV